MSVFRAAIIDDEIQVGGSDDGLLELVPGDDEEAPARSAVCLRSGGDDTPAARPAALAPKFPATGPAVCRTAGLTDVLRDDARRLARHPHHVPRRALLNLLHVVSSSSELMSDAIPTRRRTAEPNAGVWRAPGRGVGPGAPGLYQDVCKSHT
jgi:hypothetical protein